MRYYSVSNSVPTTSVMVWENNKWQDLWDMCKVYSTCPYIFMDSEGYLWESIDVRDTIYYDELKDYPKEFWEGQPVMLVRP